MNKNKNISKQDELDDPVWDYVLASKLSGYLEDVRNFWNRIEDIAVNTTGVHEMSEVLQKPAPGLMYRVTNTPVRSPIKGIQVFPFVPAAYLDLPNVAGGASKMIHRVCLDAQFTLDEFTIIEKSNLPSTYHAGQFLAFVPTALLQDTTFKGKWIYFTAEEMKDMLMGMVPVSAQNKLIKYV